MPWNKFINFVGRGRTDVVAALEMNGGAQNMGEKIIFIFSLSIIPINKKNQIIR